MPSSESNAKKMTTVCQWEISVSRVGSELRISCSHEDEVIGLLQVRCEWERSHACVLAADVEEPYQRQGVGTAMYTTLRDCLQAAGVTTLGGCLEGSGVVQIREKVFGPAHTDYFLGEAKLTPEEAIHHMDVLYGRLRVISHMPPPIP